MEDNSWYYIAALMTDSRGHGGGVGVGVEWNETSFVWTCSVWQHTVQQIQFVRVWDQVHSLTWSVLANTVDPLSDFKK